MIATDVKGGSLLGADDMQNKAAQITFVGQNQMSMPAGLY